MTYCEIIDTLAKCPTYTLAEMKKRTRGDTREWEMRNDMIERVTIRYCDHGFLSLGIDFTSGKQGVGYGHASEANIGLMILALTNLLGKDRDNCDILEAFAGTPIRVWSKFHAGASVVDCNYIGNFMKDKFIYVAELVMLGLKD